MDRIAGLIPRRNMPAGVQLTAGQTRQLCFNVIDKLIELHRVDWKAAGLEKRSEEHTSELQSLMRISYAVFCLKKKKKMNLHIYTKLTYTQFSLILFGHTHKIFNNI